MNILGPTFLLSTNIWASINCTTVKVFPSTVVLSARGATTNLYLEDVAERGAGLHVGSAEVGELPLVEVDDGPLEVVGAVVEE